MAFEEGPFIQAACFCETVLQDTTGTFSLIRIVDTIEQSASGPNPPEHMPPISFRLKLVIMLKSGEARGRWDLKIIPQLPTGETKTPLLFTVHLEGDEKGHNVILDFAFTLEHEGLHYFNIFLDQDKLTAIPLRVKYSRQVTSLPAPQSAS
jgi:hypothetical protein